VVETRNGRLGTSAPALALGLVGVVQKNLEARVLGNAETLGTLLSTVDPDDSTVSQERTLNHAAAFGHSIHLPFRVGIKRPDTAARWVAGSGNVLVRAATADDDVGVVVVGLGQGHHDGSTSVGVGAVGTGQVRQSANNGSSLNLEDLSRLGDSNEEVAILHQVHEGVHVVGLVLAQDFHVEALSAGRTVSIEDLVGRVVVLGLSRVESVLGSGCNKDAVITHDLSGGVPARSVELNAGLAPCLAVERGVTGGSLQVSDTTETIADGRVNEIERGVTAERDKATISQENATRAESISLVGEGSELAGGGIVLGRVGILAVTKLEIGVVLNLVQEDNLAVLHETSVHGRDTRSALDLKATGLSGSRRRAGGWGSYSRSILAWSVLATLTAVSSSVTTVAVHAAAASLGPVAANSVAKLGSAGSIGGSSTGRGASGRRLAKDRLARGSSRGRSGCGGLGRGSRLDRGSVFASVLASICLEAVSVSAAAVSVRRTATTIWAVRVACCASKVLSTSAVVPCLCSGGCSLGSGLGSGLVGAA